MTSLASTGLVPEDRAFGRYWLRYRIAQGGMASVFLAQLVASEGFRKWVAIKVIHPHLAADRAFVDMFLNEARLSARLDHPNICQVFDFGETDSTYYIAMEYLHGESLSALVRQHGADKPLPTPIAARIIADTASALHNAHFAKAGVTVSPAGIVHRDVSPQNIFVLYDGVTKLVDFGIARSTEYLGERTETGHVRGKLAYMAPEQARKLPTDSRADIFALGVVLWEITAGQRLFKRSSDIDTLMAVVSEPPPAPSSIVPGYPRELERIVMRALEREPDKRYATAAEMARDLEEYLVSTRVAASALAVRDFMHQTCAARFEQRSLLLSTASTAAPPTSRVPESETASWGEKVVPEQTSTATNVTAESSQPGASNRSPATTWVIAAVALISGASASYLWVSQQHPVTPPPTRTVLAAANGPTVPPTLAPPVASLATATADAGAHEIPFARATNRPAAPPAGESPTQPRRHASPRAARHAEPTESGYLNLAAVPTAEAREGGRSLGYTPFRNRTMAVGRHVLRLTPVDGGPARTIVVSIRPNETTTSSVRWP